MKSWIESLDYCTNKSNPTALDLYPLPWHICEANAAEFRNRLPKAQLAAFYALEKTYDQSIILKESTKCFQF